MGNYENFLTYAKKTMLSECTANEFADLFPAVNSDIVIYLKRAIENHEPTELDYVIYVIFCLNIYNSELIEILNPLLIESRHYKHEDIVDLLSDYKSSSSCSYLYKASLMKLSYLTYMGDETFAFASKCIHLLGKINDTNSKCCLEKLTECDEPIIKKYAEKQLMNT